MDLNLLAGGYLGIEWDGGVVAKGDGDGVATGVGGNSARSWSFGPPKVVAVFGNSGLEAAREDGDLLLGRVFQGVDFQGFMQEDWGGEAGI